jgi:hypothetical protein
MNKNQTESKLTTPEQESRKGLDETTCSGVVVWAEDAIGTARKCVYDEGDFVRMTRETRINADSEWSAITEKIIHKAELRAASVFLPNAIAQTPPDSGTKNHD